MYQMAHDKRLVNINCSLFIQGSDFANSGEEQLWGWRGGDREDSGWHAQMLSHAASLELEAVLC